jgi:uncharacterized protein
MSWRTDTDWYTTPVPPGWPGDDPTLPDDVEALGLGSRPVRRSERRAPRRRLGLWAARPTPRGDVDDLDDLGRVDLDRVDLGGGHTSHGVDGSPADSRPRPGRATGQGVAVHREPRRAARDEHLGAPAPDDVYDDDQDDDLVAGVQPAGRALVIMVATLVLAMLVNADALVERAEQQPPGDARDRSLAVWHPVQDVSHALQLHRVRQLADRVAGNDGTTTPAPASGRDARRAPGAPHGRDEPGGVGDDTGPGDSDARDADGAPDRSDGGAEGADGSSGADPGQVRTPTADDPLTMWIGGDSVAELLGPSLATTVEATGLVDATVHYEMASGLTRPDYYDWPAALADDLAEHEPEIVVIVLGANDGQGIVLADGTPVQQVSDPAWAVEYRRRVGALMDDLRAEGRMVLWLGQPPMRDPDFGARLAIVNQAFEEEAATRPWVTYVDPAASLADEAGSYADARPGAGGTPVEVRRPDGIHLTAAGADLLADQVFDEVTARVDLTGDDGAGD